MIPSPWTPTRAELTEALGPEVPKYRTDQLWAGLYQQLKAPEEISVLPGRLRTMLANKYQPRLSISKCQESTDGTVKWLFTAPDNAQVETVLIPTTNRSTVCISSQSGCAMGCVFCATGQAGYVRNLTVGEILEQVVVASTVSTRDGARLSNVVFMGMGEPLANYDNTMAAAHRLNDDFGIGARSITVSTVGLIGHIKRFAKEPRQFGLAVSLHAASDEKRTKLIPINKANPIEPLINALVEYRAITNRRVSFEWAMMEDINDTYEDAQALSRLALTVAAHVNLIPLNRTPLWPTQGSTPETIAQFVGWLTANGVNVTVRQNRGADIDAACGQLQNQSDILKIERRNQ